MTMKTCFKCGIEKDLSEFYVHKQMADGHLNKCKECNKLDVRENRKIRLEYYRRYDKSRMRRGTAQDLRDYRKRNPEKYMAHQAVEYAKRKGVISPMPCEICGDTARVNAHHEDYSKPLDVIWLCTIHHKWIHS